MARATILSIDGGGIRGIIPARIVAEIEQRTGRAAADLFDLIAGTSTGGIIALALAMPEGNSRKPKYTGAELVNLYEKYGEKIFSRSLWHTIKSVGGLNGPKYEPDGIESVLSEYFGDVRLRDVLTRVLVTSYNTAGPAPAFFKSWRTKTDKNFNYRLREIARATSAAPTFFPPLDVPDLALGKPDMCLIDGGVFANNPAMCAWAEVPQLFQDVNEFIVVSIGRATTRTRCRTRMRRAGASQDGHDRWLRFFLTGSATPSTTKCNNAWERKWGANTIASRETWETEQRWTMPARRTFRGCFALRTKSSRNRSCCSKTFARS